jgi:anti-sigma B factor antagonist
MDVNVKKEKRNNILVFTILEKELLYNHVAYLKERLFLEIAEGNRQLVLNLEQVINIDSSGLGAILFGTRHARNLGGNLVLFGLNPNIESIIKIAQLDKALTIFRNVDEAISFYEST